MIRSAITVGLAVGIAAAAVTTQAPTATTPVATATTATQVYSGKGWWLHSNYLDAGTWKIVWYDTATRSAIKPYAKLTAAHLASATGNTFNVTDTIWKTSATCPAYHTIVIRLTNTVDRDNATFCVNSTGGQLSSRVLHNKDDWYSYEHQGSREIYRRHVVSHELGHAVGLGHSPKCTCSPSPLMRGDKWGGYWTTSGADNYTPYDINGLKALVSNRGKVATR